MHDYKNYQAWSDEEILKERAKILLHAGNDKSWQELLKQMCKIDPVFFFTFFAYTKDPKRTPANLPFIPFGERYGEKFDFQKDLLIWLQDKLNKQESGLVEKCRQLGISWVIVTWGFYNWLFRDDFIFIIGSRKEELVDKRDKDDTLFYKLDYNLKRMPKWLLPRGFTDKDRRHLILVNRENGSTIFGESSNQDFGRGATVSAALLDEFASWAEAGASWDGISQATNVKIPISTPKHSCFFKTLRFSKKIEVKTLPWMVRYGQDWYEKQKETKSAETLAQEVDLSYDVTGRGKVYEEFDLVDIGKYEYNPKLPLYTAIDFGFSHNNAIIWAQHDPKTDKVYIIDSYQNSKKTIEFYMPFYTGKIKTSNKYKNYYTKEEKTMIKRHLGWGRSRNFGDPSGRQRSITTDTSVIQIMNKEGIHVFSNTRAQSFPARRDATKILLRYMNVDESNTMFIKSIEEARYPERKETSQATSPVIKPVHDFTADYRSALEYLAVNLKLKKRPPRRVNYLKNVKADEDGFLSEDRKKIEKKKRVLRYSFRSYS